MKTITINLPEEVNESDVKMAIAAMLFDKAILSSGQAAEFAGITKREFLETVGKYGVSIFGETERDLSIGQKISSLPKKIKNKMTGEEIEEQLKKLRNEWQRDF